MRQAWPSDPAYDSRGRLGVRAAAGEVTAPSLHTEGFVHCSDPGTVHLPANRLYAGRDDLILLRIDPALLPAGALRWEPGEPGREASVVWFPHVYGPIPVGAVIAAAPYRAGPDGYTPAQPDS